MQRIAKHSAFVITLAALVTLCLSKEEEVIQMNDSGEGNQCDQDESVARSCLACTSLPFPVSVTLASCCSTETAFQFCSVCLEDEASCAKLMQEMDDLKAYSDEEEEYYDDASDDVIDGDYYDDAFYSDGDILGSDDSRESRRTKRFGTLFMKSPKRYGRLLFGKRVPEKRYGRLYMGSGSYFGKRETGSDDYYGNDVAKRFGYLLGSSYKLGKRDMSVSTNEYIPDKRFGQLFMGKGRMFGKRDMDKRYGRLFFGGKGLFGKRVDPEIEHGNGKEKRYGRLFMGRRRGSLFG